MIDGLVIINGDFKVFEANSSFCRMLGYSHEEILNLHIWDWDTRIPPDTNRKMIVTLLEDTHVHFKSNQKRKDGSLNVVEIQGQSFGYKDAMWQICLCREIIDNKKAESDLKKFQIDLNETQRIAHIGSWELDLETDVLVCSSEMKRIWGIPQDEQLAGMGSLKISVIPEDQARLDQAIQNSIRKAIPYDLEYRIIDRQGNLKHLHSRSKVTGNSRGRAIRLYGMCQDITERKKHEEERKLNEIRLLQSQEISHIGTYEYNLKTNELWWSDELYKIYSIKAGTTVNRDNYIEYIHPDDIGRVKVMMDLEKEDYHIEYRIIRPSGEIRYLSTFVGKHEYRDGERYLIRGTSQDITEQRLIELEKNQLELKLNHAQKMETIGTLAGGVAHDINNILGIIIGNTELCMDDVPEWNPAYSNLKEIVNAVLRAKEVIRQLLTFSRNMEVKKEIIDIVSVINDTLKFLRSTISATIEIEKRIEVSKPNIIADPTQIDQIIMNICANSAQAMEESGGKIMVSVENITIDHVHADDSDALANGEYIKIKISDNGPGIPAELHEKIFDPYFTTKEVGKGSGMGLAVVQGIVNKHKGGINVESEPGKGATFTILLPCIKDDDKKGNTNTNIYSGGKRLLFIDDEQQITKIASRMLESMGFKVDQETNPQKALELFKENPADYDLVITDMAMPQMNALKLFKEIRDLRPDIPVILSSGHNPLIDKEKAKETGFSAYILKPFTKAELSTAVQNAIKKTE
jgi:PAS domain S-box-containing protein